MAGPMSRYSTAKTWPPAPTRTASERRQGVDDSHAGLLYEQMYANAYVAHPYQNPVIGWPSDIENWTQEDLETFYQRYYAPNNITMVFSVMPSSSSLSSNWPTWPSCSSMPSA